MIGPGRAKLAAALGTTSVVTGLVPGQDRPQRRWPKIPHRVDKRIHRYLPPAREHKGRQHGPLLRCPQVEDVTSPPGTQRAQDRELSCDDISILP